MKQIILHIKYLLNNCNIYLYIILKTALTIMKTTKTDPGMSLGWWHSSLYGSAVQDTQTDYFSGELSVRCGFMTNCQVVRNYEVPLFPL